MPAPKYGLNVLKKPTSLANRPPPAKRKTIFDDDSGPEDGPDPEAAEAITSVGGLSPSLPSPSSSKPSKSTKNESPSKIHSQKPGSVLQISQYGDLSTNHTTALHASTAQSLDPSIYDYDAVYDSLHASKAKSSSTFQGPKYMQSLLAAAEVRKRDQLRAKEKMLAKEREAEGDEFADKEKFVTGAYKAQQEEVRRMEVEEMRREKEEMERRKREGGGMVRLYKNLLERDGKRHEEAVKAAEKGKEKGVEVVEDGVETGKSEGELAREKGAVVNDDGVVVDKRQLLSAGLNIAAKPKPAASSQSDAARNAARSGISAGFQGCGGAKQTMRERQTRMLEAQLVEASKRAADDEEVQREALERAAKSKKTQGDISSAKERYLQRKREAAAAAAAKDD
ncbi:hypothetical protein MMC30_003192 [Trapelia coarctata]|nr:hypothetical protein [Trapelia coarctata]